VKIKKRGGEKVTPGRLHVKQRTRDLRQCLHLTCYYVPRRTIEYSGVPFKDTNKKS